MASRRRGANGEPWLRKFNGGWYVSVRGGKAPIPIRDREGAHIRGKGRKAEAFAAWHEMMSVSRAPAVGDENEARVVLELYLQRHLAGSAAPKTVAEYTDVFQRFTDRWPGLLIRDLRSEHVKTWWQEHPSWGPSYRNYMGTALKAALNWAAGAEGNNIISKNPLQGMKLPRSRSRGADALISDEDHGRLIAAVPDDLRQVLIALRHTGTRPNHIWRAEARNLDVKQGVLIYADWNTDPDLHVHKTFKKTGRPLIVPLTPTVLDMCKKLAKQYPEGPLFRTKKGEPWDACKLANRLRWYKRSLGLMHVVCYGYRHSVATHLLEQGVPDAEVAAVLGQANTAMIYRHYGHLGARIKRLTDTLAKHRPALAEETESRSVAGKRVLPLRA
jgi:integrase